jgi:DNA-directed RNA polymerase subunit RPC12/RpoP
MKYHRRGGLKCTRCWSRKVTALKGQADGDSMKVQCTVCGHEFRYYYTDLLDDEDET